ncbi:hypothetical protein [Shimia sp.]|uniref:hypothetical protein n=1 Tax=Shimia sp. TaxID=1954381 RepID=UPI003BAB51AC
MAQKSQGYGRSRTGVFYVIMGIADAAIKAAKSKSYSELVSEHVNADMYQTLYWCSLIAKGKDSISLEKMRAHYFKDGQKLLLKVRQPKF